MNPYDFNLDVSTENPKFLKVARYNIDLTNRENGKPLTKTLEVLDRKDSVAVLIYNTDTLKFTWVEQFRIGHAMKASSEVEAWPLEPVAGMIEPGQTPAQAAIREAEEEAKTQVKDLISLGSFVLSPGISSERMHLFVAFVNGPDPDVRHGGLAEEQENIVVHHLSAEETADYFAAGRMTGMPTMCMWQYAQLIGIAPKSCAPAAFIEHGLS